MEDSSSTGIVLIIISIVVGIVTILLGPRFQLPIAITYAFFMLSFFISEVNKKVENQDKIVSNLKEKLNIQEQLIDIKANLSELNKRVFKK